MPTKKVKKPADHKLKPTAKALSARDRSSNKKGN